MASAGRQSRRVLEVRGVSLSALKNHPTLDESDMNLKHRPTTTKSQSSSLLTNSSFSSSADDFDLDRESNVMIQQMFIDIDSLLYDERFPAECKEDIIDECCLWKEKHPHYRVTGQQILPENEDGFILLPQYSSEGSLNSPLSSDSPLTDSSKLFVEGVQMELNSPSVYNFCSISDEAPAVTNSVSTEEIIATTGSYEETIASDGQMTKAMQISADTNVSIVKNLSDKVMDVLCDKFYKDVTNWLQKLIRSYVGFVRSEMYECERFQQENSKFINFPNLRLSTAPPRNSFATDIDGILTISPSRLQMRIDKSMSLPSTALSPYSKQHANLTPNSAVPLKKLHAAMRLIPLEKKVFKERDIKTSGASNTAYTRSNILPPIQTPDDGRTQSKGKSLRPITLSSSSRTRNDLKLKSTKEELSVNKNPDVNK